MEAQIINTVQSTWKIIDVIDVIALKAASLFYSNLFEADPSLKALFKGNMEDQGKKLMQMIGTAVEKLNDLENLIPVLQSLAQRHASYGVKEAHYHTVGESLLKTLEQGLGEAFTPQVKSAWIEVYSVIAETMIAHQKLDT